MKLETIFNLLLVENFVKVGDVVDIYYGNGEYAKTEIVDRVADSSVFLRKGNHVHREGITTFKRNLSSGIFKIQGQ